MSPENPKHPESPGASPVQDLRKLLTSWAREPGPPMSRPSWNDLQLLLMPLKGAPAAFWETLLPSLPPSHALLATMVIAQTDATVRSTFLQRACNAALQTPPGQLLPLLKLFPKDLVLSGFGPALLSPPPLGPLAASLLSGLEITIAPGDIPLVLAASAGSPEMQGNLVRLVPVEHIDTIVQDLHSQLDGSKPDIANLRDRFVKLLDARRSARAPEAASGVSAPPAEAPRAVSEPSVAVQTPSADAVMSQAQARLSVGVPAHLPGRQAPGGKNIYDEMYSIIPGIDRNLLIGFLAIAASVPLVLYFTGDSPQEQAEATVMPMTPAKAPKFWIDAVSKRKITREFIAADNDFQMGEMFLIRQQYGEALSLFRDALHRDPEHVSAQFRIGFCLFASGDNKGAAEAFRTSLAMKSDLPQANLYLARIAVAASDWDQAISHYQKEFDLSGDVAIALEYAGVLRNLGRFPEAIALLSGLQSRFAGHLEVVNLLAQLREDARGLAQ